MPSLLDLVTMTPERIRDMVADEARRQGVDPALATSIAQLESQFRPGVTSPKGAIGVMQLMPATAKSLDVTNPYDPVENIRGGVRYLRDLAGLFPGRPDLQAAAYQAGPGRIQRAQTPINASDGNLTNQGYVTKALSLMSPRSAEAAERKPDILSLFESAPQPTEAKPDILSLFEPAPVAQSGSQEPTTLPVMAPSPEEREAAILRDLGYDLALVRQAKDYQPGTFTRLFEGPLGEETGTAGNLMRRFSLGFFAPFMKGGALVTEGLSKLGLASEADVALSNAYQSAFVKARDRIAQQSPTGLGFAAETAGNMAFPLPTIPGTAALGPLAKAAIQGGASAALQPTPVSQGESTLPGTAMQAGAGAVVGGGSAALMQGAQRLPALLPGVGRAGRVAESIERVTGLPAQYRAANLPQVAEALEKVPNSIPAGRAADRLFAAFRQTAGEQRVAAEPLRVAVQEVRQALGDPGSPLEAAGIGRLLARLAPDESAAEVSLRTLGETLPDLTKLARNPDGKVRFAASQLLEGVYAAIKDAPGEAADFLRAGRLAFRRDSAVDALQKALRVGGNVLQEKALDSGGTMVTVNPDAALKVVDRLVNARGNRYFQGSFTTAELDAIQQALRGVAGTPSISTGITPSGLPPYGTLLKEFLPAQLTGAALGRPGLGAAVGAGLVGLDIASDALARWLLQPGNRALLTSLRSARQATVPLTALPGLEALAGVAGGRGASQQERQ